MFRSCLAFSTLLLIFIPPAVAFAQAPFPVESVATVEELELEVPAQINELSKLLADETTFDDSQPAILQKFGLLAVIGQALAEHPKKSKGKVNGPALRDAALVYGRDGSLDQAKAALEGVKKVIVGQMSGEHAVEHAWNKLINMHGMMEEMNGRNSKILRVLRRPRGRPEEGAHASVLGVLSLAMYADTHEVKEADTLPQWQQWSTEYREAVITMGEAIRAKDAKAARQWFDKANATCDKCHEVFQ